MAYQSPPVERYVKSVRCAIAVSFTSPINSLVQQAQTKLVLNLEAVSRGAECCRTASGKGRCATSAFPTLLCPPALAT
jgi:hypothetical protein